MEIDVVPREPEHLADPRARVVREHQRGMILVPQRALFQQRGELLRRDNAPLEELPRCRSGDADACAWIDGDNLSRIDSVFQRKGEDSTGEGQ